MKFYNMSEHPSSWKLLVSLPSLQPAVADIILTCILAVSSGARHMFRYKSLKAVMDKGPFTHRRFPSNKS